MGDLDIYHTVLRNSSLATIEKQKANKNNTELAGGLKLYSGSYDYNIYDHNQGNGIVFSVGEHNFVFTALGAIWIDDKFIASV